MYGKEFEVNGQVKQLRYDFNAIADIEEHANKGITALFNEDMIGFHTIRLLFWGGLRHADRGITTQRAGQIVKQMLEEGHTIESLMELIMDGITKSGVFAENKDENPTPPQTGTKKSQKKSES